MSKLVAKVSCNINGKTACPMYAILDTTLTFEKAQALLLENPDTVFPFKIQGNLYSLNELRKKTSLEPTGRRIKHVQTYTFEKRNKTYEVKFYALIEVQSTWVKRHQRTLAKQTERARCAERKANWDAAMLQ